MNKLLSSNIDYSRVALLEYQLHDLEDSDSSVCGYDQM